MNRCLLSTSKQTSGGAYPHVRHRPGADISRRRVLSSVVVLDDHTLQGGKHRETISRTVEVDFTHKKQIGGAGEFAKVPLLAMNCHRR